MLGKIEQASETTKFFDPMATDLVASVTAGSVTRLASQAGPEGGGSEGSPGAGAKVVLVDCGCKTSITRALVARGLEVIRVPYDHYFLGIDYDGLLISNGPGDPKMCGTTIRHVEHALAVGKPILGICLGHQILALAAGAETYKLKFGHRSQNQPCLELERGTSPRDKPSSRRCVVTSQNHGYAVRADALPDDWEVWFANANDGTVEGIRHRSKPFRAVQFHPEARPGPTDTGWILDEFAARVKGGRR
jgi:carbamoyl-phosphate synthase small subunit